MPKSQPPARAALVALLLAFGLLGGLFAGTPSAHAQLHLPPILLARVVRGSVETMRREDECVAVVQGVARAARLGRDTDPDGEMKAIDRAARVARRAQDRVFVGLFGPVGYRMGFYAGKNLARDDASRARVAGFKLSF